MRIKKESSENRCTAFFNITRQFVDSAAARAGDILLPSNDWNFAIKPTPIPELDALKEDQHTALIDQNGNPISVGQIAQENSRQVSQGSLISKPINQIPTSKR